jgi:hypothetical protein
VPQGGRNRGSRMVVVDLIFGADNRQGIQSRTNECTSQERLTKVPQGGNWQQHGGHHGGETERSGIYDTTSGAFHQRDESATTTATRQHTQTVREMQAIWQLPTTGFRVSYVGSHGQGLKTLNKQVYLFSLHRDSPGGHGARNR